MTFAYVASVPDAVADPRTLAVERAQCVALLSGAVEVLERRRVAGTLLEGKCAAAEEAWRTGSLLRTAPGLMMSTGDNAASFAALFGYEVFLRAATIVMAVFQIARQFAAECPDTQLQCFHAEVGLTIEATYAKKLRYVVSEAAAYELDARLVQLLVDALQRLERSGVLHARGVSVCVPTNTTQKQAFGLQQWRRATWRRACAAARWTAAAPRRRTRRTSSPAPRAARSSTAAADTRWRAGRATKRRARRLARLLLRTRRGRATREDTTCDAPSAAAAWWKHFHRAPDGRRGQATRASCGARQHARMHAAAPAASPAGACCASKLHARRCVCPKLRCGDGACTRPAASFGGQRVKDDAYAEAW